MYTNTHEWNFFLFQNIYRKNVQLWFTVNIFFFFCFFYYNFKIRTHDVTSPKIAVNSSILMSILGTKIVLEMYKRTYGFCGNRLDWIINSFIRISTSLTARDRSEGSEAGRLFFGVRFWPNKPITKNKYAQLIILLEC